MPTRKHVMFPWASLTRTYNTNPVRVAEKIGARLSGNTLPGLTQNQRHGCSPCIWTRCCHGHCDTNVMAHGASFSLRHGRSDGLMPLCFGISGVRAVGVLQLLICENHPPDLYLLPGQRRGRGPEIWIDLGITRHCGPYDSSMLFLAAKGEDNQPGSMYYVSIGGINLLHHDDPPPGNRKEIFKPIQNKSVPHPASICIGSSFCGKSIHPPMQECRLPSIPVRALPAPPINDAKDGA